MTYTTSFSTLPDLPAGASEQTVLCVQPAREHRAALKVGLAGYRVTAVETGLDAVRAFNAGSFDAYVLDYWLADWSGLSLCRQIRKGDPHAPIVFFSAAEGDDQIKRAMRAGASVYLFASAGGNALADALRKSLLRAQVQNLQARVEEERVIQEELQRRAAMVIEASALARIRAAEAIERAARTRAHKAFMTAGGTLAGFEKLWPDVYKGCASTQRTER
jgi:DNA-binding response OmpR family regulator